MFGYLKIPTLQFYLTEFTYAFVGSLQEVQLKINIHMYCSILLVYRMHNIKKQLEIECEKLFLRHPNHIQ